MVEQDEIGTVLIDQSDGLVAALRRAHHFDVPRTLERTSHSVEDERLVVGDEKAHGQMNLLWPVP